MRDRLIEALALKDLARAGWVRVGVPSPESVAAHTWGVTFLVLVLCPADLDREAALAIATVHDLAEVRIGDLTPHDDLTDKPVREREAFVEMTAEFPNHLELVGFFDAYGTTPEGRFVKACDKLDMALMAARYESEDLDTAEFVDSALAKLGSSELAALVRPA
ncbi:MAG: HD domain-containing protein [Proteobacteria bacterium]|nr:HD domain-containing protein [Pseudomonadota bacterium]MCP4920375.1 HD domain-containing protein [Pseudomonadota bacterium]